MQRRAADSRWKIDGELYAVARFRRGGRAPGINVANSEGIAGNEGTDAAVGFAAKIPDLREGQIELTSATYDDANNPFGAPINLVEGEYYHLEHFPAGLDHDSADYGTCLCVEVSHEGSIPGPQPVRAVFETDGEYRHPGESG